MISKRTGERNAFSSTHCYHICSNLSRDIVHYIFINLASISSLTARRIRVMELNLRLLNRYLLFCHLLNSIGDANNSIQYPLYISPHSSILYFVFLCIDVLIRIIVQCFILHILSNLLNNHHSHYLL